MNKIISTLLAASIAAAAMPMAAMAADGDIFSYEQSFEKYPSDTGITAGTWSLGNVSGISDAGYLPLSSTNTNLYTAKYYIDSSNYITDGKTVEISAEFKVDSVDSGTGVVGFNFMNEGSTETELFFLGAAGSDAAETHLYIPKTSSFSRNNNAYTDGTNGYDAGTVAFGDWVKMTVKISNEQISYYANDSYLTTVDFTGHTPITDSLGINNISIAARNAVTGGAKNFTYRVYDNNTRVNDLPYYNFAKNFKPADVTPFGGAAISGERLVFQKGNILSAPITLTDYNNYDHMIDIKATIENTAAVGDSFDIISTAAQNLTSGFKMKFMSLVPNGDGTYKVLINTAETDANSVPSTEVEGYGAVPCGTDVKISIKIQPITIGSDNGSIVTYYIDGKEAAVVNRTNGKPAYGNYIVMGASGAAGKDIASIDEAEVYHDMAKTAPVEPEVTITAGERKVYGAEDGEKASIAQKFMLKPNNDTAAKYQWVIKYTGNAEQDEQTENVALDTTITGNGEALIGIILYNIPAADADNIGINLVSVE